MMAWFNWGWEKEKQLLKDQVQRARDEASLNWEAKVTAESERDTERREKNAMEKSRDWWQEKADKQDTQNSTLHSRIKALQEEKEAQRVELAAIRDADANRPVVEVEVYDSKQGRKAQPCKRFVARHAGTVVAVSPPQGTNDDAHARERIMLLSQGRWVIIDKSEQEEV